jgi:hypothetical protein
MHFEMDDLPDAVCILNPDHAVMSANQRFVHCVSPISIGLPFLENFIGKEDQERFRNAIQKPPENQCDDESNLRSWRSVQIMRNIETLTTTSM